MKHIFRIFFTSLLTLTLFTACNQDDINMPLWVEKNEITVLAHGGTEKIKVNSEYEWVLSYRDLSQLFLNHQLNLGLQKLVNRYRLLLLHLLRL